MNTLKKDANNQLKPAPPKHDGLTTIEAILELPGIVDIVTINGLVGTLQGAFNDPADGALTGDGIEIHSFTSYLLIDIGLQQDMPPGINVHGEEE